MVLSLYLMAVLKEPLLFGAEFFIRKAPLFMARLQKLMILKQHSLSDPQLGRKWRSPRKVLVSGTTLIILFILAWSWINGMPSSSTILLLTVADCAKNIYNNCMNYLQLQLQGWPVYNFGDGLIDGFPESQIAELPNMTSLSGVCLA